MLEHNNYKSTVRDDSDVKNESKAQPLRLVMSTHDTQQNMRSNKNIIVNPWTAGRVDTLLPAINMSVAEAVRSEKVSLENNHNDSVDVEHGEPVYEEIKHMQLVENKMEATDEKVIYESMKQKTSNLSKHNDITDEKINDEFSEVDRKQQQVKNEIVYWQITAKEVAKFHPCTETIIERS